MGVGFFFLLALAAAAIIAYPLLPGQRTVQPEPVVTDADIERAVRTLRQARSDGSQSCPSCGKPHQLGDRFCVRCGATLPQAAAVGPACPSCGTTVHEEDQFCAKCGHRLVAGEDA